MIHPLYITDRNGNRLQFTPNSSKAGGGLPITDTLGRVVVTASRGSNQANGTFPEDTADPESTGVLTYTVGGLPYTLTYTTATAAYQADSKQIVNTPGNGSIYTCQPTFKSNLNVPVVQSISVPNGGSYKFSYEPVYGLLSEIDYPTGAWVKYRWKLSDTLSESVNYGAHGQAGNGGSITYPGYCLFEYQTPVVAERTVGNSSDQNKIAQQQTFTYNTAWDSDGQWNTKTTTVLTADYVSGQNFTTVYKYGPVARPVQPNEAGQMAVLLPVETRVQTIVPGMPVAAKTVTKTWADQFEMTSQQTQVAGGPPSTEIYCYTNSDDRVWETDEFDFGKATPSLTPPTGFAVAFSPACGSSGASRKTLTGYSFTTPCITAVYDGTGNRVAETDAYIDGGSTPCWWGGVPVGNAVPNLIAGTHDETNYGPSAPAQRGNPTRIVKWSSTGGSITTTATYDETGQLLTSTDACGNAPCSDMSGGNHTATYSYADSFNGGNPSGNSNAYVTGITNALGQTQLFSYNYGTGQLASATDANGQTTRYSYADPLNRLTQTSLPDGGSTTISYNDAAPSPSVTTTTAASPSPSLVSTSVMDGMGHVVQTQLNSDPSGTDYVDTVYNGLGQVQAVSNPHRSGSSTTDGTTFFAYDALGRKVTQTQPDGSTLQWCYNGIATSGVANCPGSAASFPSTMVEWVDSYDELGNHRQHVSDALGRLVAVMEPDAGNNLAAETDYGYDALNNLARVDQYAAKPGSADAVRQFSYDSLSRLTSASNPETGTVSYVYDANGNLSTKTDARGVVIRHCYDTLNRLLSKSSPDQGCPAPAPFAAWGYDQTSVQVGSGTLQVPNGIGRLTSEASASPAGSYCGAYTYDALGRVIRNFFTWFCSGTGQYFIKTAGYDLAGNRTYYENGDWRAFSYGYNGAGQVTGVTTGPTFQPADATLISGIGYDSTGGAGTINLGNGAQEQMSRDNRLRVWMDNLMPSPSATNAIYGWNAAFDTASNLRHVNDWYVMGNWDYTYDPLNRLYTSVASLPYPGWGGAAGAQTASTGCQYSYDTFGNRTYMGPYGNGKQCVTLSLSYSYHRVSTPGMALYDAAGNMQYDANSNNSLTYDAEGRVATVSGPKGNASYLYDPEGQRVATNVNGTTNIFARDFDGHLAWTNFLSGGPEEVWLNGRHFGSVYTNVDHSLNHLVYSMVDQVGTERAQFDSNQNLVASFTSNPFGDNQQTTAGSNTDTTHFTGKERDAESGLDNFGPRYYGSSMGRFMSPDEFGGHLEDPQTLNKYSYVGNNPLSRIDPTGHDFWQSCSTASATCGNQNIGTKDNPLNHLVQGTTTDGKFSASVITSASLGQAGSGNSATVNGTGVEITSKTGTAQGIFINGTASADIQGSGAGWNQFSFHVDSNDAAHGVLTAGTATYQGSGGWHGMVNAIEAMKWNGHGPFVYSEESTRWGNPFHPGALNYRFSSGDHPELFNYGPSPHFAVVPSGFPKSDFHVDSETGPMHGPCALAGVGC